MRWLQVLAVALVLAWAAETAHAQTTILPAAPYYATMPNQGLTPQGNAPVQQQILQNYRTQLQQSQRDLQQQNPSGTSRDQLNIGGQLNGYITPGPTPYAPPSSPNIGPGSPLGSPTLGAGR